MTTRENIADIYPLSPLQQGLLFHSLYAPETAQYFEQLTCRLEGPLDLGRFDEAWQTMIARHSILRSAFVSQGTKEPVQVVMKDVHLPVHRLDWRNHAAGEQARLFEEFLAEDEARGFALHRPPLLRVTLIRLGDEDWRLVWSHHHLLLDGWSLPLLLRELFAVYHARGGDGRGLSLPPVRPYGDYIAWLGRQDRAAAEAFWRATLGDMIEATPLSVDHGTAGPTDTADRVVTRIAAIDATETEALRNLARRSAVTLNTVVQAAWALVLGRHGRREDVVFGVTVSGRPTDLPGAEEMVGLFINTLPLRVRIDPERALGDWLVDIQRHQSDVQRFGYASLTDIHGWSGVPRGQPLFRTLFAFENFPLGEALDTLTGELRIREPLLVEKTNYPLTLVVVPGDGLVFKLSYDSESVPDWVAAGLLEQVRYVLASMALRPDAPVRAFGIVPPPETEPHRRFAGTGSLVDAPSLPAAFAVAVQRHAERVAVVDGSRSFTYREIDASAEEVAVHLRARGVGPGTLVGLLFDRSADLIIGMLAVVKAGGAYVPLDPGYPAERLRFMVTDSGCQVVLTAGETAATAAGFSHLASEILDLRVLRQAGARADHTAPAPTSDSAAYVIYTSGSTGKPKGVVVTQHNLLRLFSATHHWFGFDQNDVWTFFHSFAFDFSVWEIWGALLHGGRLVVVPYHLSRDPDAFYELLARERVTVLNQTPSAFGQLMAAEERRREPLPLALRTVVFGGEALDLGSLRPWFKRHGDRMPRLVNMYGITETTVHVTYREIRAADSEVPRGSLIGCPIPDLEIRLLDTYGHPVPDGVPGEICVAGAGVARGYLGQPELTAQRFVVDPFGSGVGARMYRSGDLARRLPDGDLQYIGRIDFQVKVRGFRIELSEIEQALATHPAVAGALALVHADGDDKRLVAYVLRRPGHIEPTAVELRTHLRSALPEYMVPELYVALDAFPLTLNGKIDRQALPDPLIERIAVAREHATPETPVQAELARIWAEVLGVPQVGLDDDYFALGGDSIRAIRVVALAKKAGISITLRDLFARPTPRELAAAVSLAATAEADAAPVPLPQEPFALIDPSDRERLPADVEDAFPLARLQAGMLFHGDDSDATLLYHDVFGFRLRLPYDEHAWRDSLRALVTVHPVLRTSFHFDGYSEPLQTVHSDLTPPLHVHDLRALPVEARNRRVGQIFDQQRSARYDWTQPGLWRMHLARLEDDVCELIVAFHHAILDGWSLATFLSELAHHYLHRLGGREAPPAAPSGNAFRDFVVLERRSEANAESQACWDEILADAPLVRVPGWPGERGTEHLTVTRVLDSTISASLFSHTVTARLPLRTLLLAVHARALELLTGQAELVTGLISNGRPETAEGARALGLFLNTVPLRLRLPRAGSWLELARAVREAEQALLPHRHVPMAVLKRRQGGRELFATSFNYVHFHVYDGMLGRSDLQLEHSRAEESTDIPFSVTFSRDATSGGLHLSISADGQSITSAQLEAAADLYLACARALAVDPAAPSTEIPELIPAVVRGEPRSYPFEPVHAAVARRAARAPHAVAVELGERSWTYAQLAHAATHVAAWLEREGLRPGQPVVLCVERSFGLVAAMLGTLQAGGAYVPVDTECPPQRLVEILDALDRPLVLAGTVQAARLPANTRALIVDDAELSAASSATGRTTPATDPQQPAYVLFTSGSTGTPKGVVVHHGALSHHMAWFLEAFSLDDRDVILQKTPYTFDASVWEFWAALMSGSRLRLARPDGHRDPAYLAAELVHGHVTVLQLVPSVLDGLLEEPILRQARALRHLFCGGEALRLAAVARVQAILGLPVINLYGPTEATIQCAFAEIVAHDAGSLQLAPLGRPIPDVTLTVRDEWLRVVSVGTPGELCVEGPCLALGYWKDKGHTAERFPADPAAPARRLLRTGDRARLLPDGTLEFLGRLDDQVKLRGMRVEPGEVETRLALLPGVAQAVVAARLGDHGRARLVAWVELHDTAISVETLQAALAEQVPEYMMPAAWVTVHAWPRLPSGKIDRRALPEPVVVASAAVRAAPRPGVETALAEIWQQVLAVKQVSADDDFFALGGDSIACMQMVARARGQGLTIGVRDAFARPVLRDLAVLAETRAPSSAIIATDWPAEIPLTPAQAWFVELALPNPRHWNHAMLLALRQPIASERLEQAVRALLTRRDALRLRLVHHDGRWHQIVGEQAGEPVFERVDLSAIPPNAQASALRDHAATVQSSLDPERGHQFRAVHYDLGAARAGRLLLVCHHLIIDGLSWRLLLQDLALALAGSPLLPAGSFAVAAHMLAEKARAPELRREIEFWQAQLREVPAIPLDYPGGLQANLEGTTEAVTVVVPPALTSRMLDTATAALRATLPELLLAAFVHALAVWSNGKRVAFLLEGHGRDQLAEIPDAADTVGWFTAIYPVNVTLPDTDAITCLRQVKTAVRAVPGDGSGYGLLRHGSDEPALATGFEPAVGFNYLGRIDGSFEGAPFALAADEDVGPAIDPAAPRPRVLDLVIHLAAGQLQASWQFSPRLHQRDTIERVARLFLAALERLTAEPEPRQALCPADYPLAGLSDDQLRGLLAGDDLTDILPLSPVQEGMLYHALHDSRPGVYVQQVAAEIRGVPDQERLERAWQAVLAAHPMLRASFVTNDTDRPLQRIHARVSMPVAFLDLAALDDPTRSARVAAFLEEDRQRGFALDRPPLMRLTLIREGEAAWRMVWTHHHLLLDGWSLPIVFRDFLHAYEGRTPAVEARAYADFLRWLAGRDRDADAKFWRETLQDFPGATIPRGMAVAEGAAVAMAEARATCSADLTRTLEDAARRHKVTLATLVQAAWSLVLGRHAQSQDVVIGVTVSGRPDDIPGAAATVGTFINTLPLRVRLAAEQPVADWLGDIRAAQTGILVHQASALVEVARWAGLPGGTPLFEAIIVHENYPIDGVAAARSALAIDRVTSRENNHYPLSLYVLPGAALELALYHHVPRYDSGLASALLAQVQYVLEQLTRPEPGHLGDIVLLGPPARAALASWNATARSLDLARPVHERFRARAAEAPQALAVLDEERGLTYRELDIGSDGLARRLCAAGVSPGMAIGICLDRSADMLMALLAVLKAGAHYVPLDPAFPDNRLAAMIEDAAPVSVLTETRLEARLRALGVRPMLVGAEAGGTESAPVTVAVEPASLAYTIFTSGSTGRPKGVMIPHRALNNVLDSFAAVPGLTAADRLVSVTTLSFDIAALELFLPLTVGATVVIARADTAADPGRLAELLARSQATVMQATPATWRMLLAASWQPPRPGFRVWCGGEALTVELASALLERGVELWNVYGPTETTIWSTIHAGESGADATRVGRPIGNTTCYVVDDACNPLPPGVPGELVIGGAGVAHGYLGQPGRTAERFPPDPFSPTPGARLYRTGDLACFHPDGRLKILGRMDFQVKVRGFRVELGDIETALTERPDIAQAVVVAAPDRNGEARLVAHLLAAEGSARLDVSVLREHLLGRLPAYMVPSVWRYVERFPLTANRKIDRKALAAQPLDIGPSSTVPPRTPLERALAEIWKQILDIRELGVEDGFFELGGHSLAAARVHARLRDIFRMDVPLAEFLRRPTLAGLAELIQAHDPEPGRSDKIAAAYLRLLSMSDEEKAKLRARRKTE